MAEETRAQLQQALEGLSSSTRRVPVSNLTHCKHLFDDSNHMYDRNLHQLLLSIPLDSLVGGSGSGKSQQGNLPFKPTDLLLLSSKQVCGIDDLKQPFCGPWMLSLVTSCMLPQDGSSAADGSTLDAKVTVFAVPGSPEYEALLSSSNSNSSSWWVYSLSSLATAMRAFDALQQLASLSESTRTEDMSPILQAVLTGRPSAGLLRAGMGCSAELQRAVVSYCQGGPQALNTSQQNVLLQVAGRTEQSSTSSTSFKHADAAADAITLVQGPPGTGKTATVARLLSVLGCSGSRVLACAPTNVAVCQLASCYLQLLDGQQQFAAAHGGGSTHRSRPHCSSSALGICCWWGMRSVSICNHQTLCGTSSCLLECSAC